MPDVEFDSLAASSAFLDDLSRASIVTTDGEFTVGQALSHCAMSIEDSISGYPQLRSGLFRALVGPLVLHWFLARKIMHHDRGQPIPGAPVIPRETTIEDALLRLRSAISRFQSFDGTPAPHFIYGDTSKSQYDRIHAMHMADHFSQFQIGAPATAGAAISMK